MEGFYVTLPSNASLNLFKDNTLTNYVVKVERNLNLRGKWEVGMTEMHYSHSWNNINSGEMTIEQTNPDAVYNVKVRSGRYENVEDLIREIKVALNSLNMRESIEFHRDKISNYCYINVKESDTSLKLSPELCNVFGFDNEVMGTGIHKSQRQTDITEGFTAMYVYCDIVEPQLVGDVMVPLLRVVPTNIKNAGENIVERFYHTHYLPVTGKSAETIEILIRRDNGNKVSFESGKVIVVLHFRKKSE